MSFHQQPTLTPADTHEHAWTTESRHLTSEGVIRYVRCTGCGARRIDRQLHHEQPPTALTYEID